VVKATLGMKNTWSAQPGAVLDGHLKLKKIKNTKTGMKRAEINETQTIPTNGDI
jgi:hypothetical protein